MPALTMTVADQLDREATTTDPADIAGYLQDHLGQRMAAYLVGLRDAKQVGRYAKPGGPTPSSATERRLRSGYKVVRMLVEAYDDQTAKAWLFGTNTRLDDRAPIQVLGQSEDPGDVTAVVRAARQFASFA